MEIKSNDRVDDEAVDPTESSNVNQALHIGGLDGEAVVDKSHSVFSLKTRHRQSSSRSNRDV